MDIAQFIILGIFIVLALVYIYYYINFARFKKTRISGNELEKLSFKDALVVDVRTKKEYAAGHAKNAVNIPYSAMESGIRALDPYKNKKIIFYCTLDVMSRKAFNHYKSQGFKNIWVADGFKQYSYDKVTFPIVLMNDFKGRLLENGTEPLNMDEDKEMKTEYNISDRSFIDFMDMNTKYGLFGKDSKEAINLAQNLDKAGYNIFLLIEDFKRENFVKAFDKEDFENLNSSKLEEDFCPDWM